MTKINWFPGHMKKTADTIRENLKLVDVVVELLDARIPFSSQNPVLTELTQGKQRVFALAKADLADKKSLSDFIKLAQADGISAVMVNSLTGMGIGELKKQLAVCAKPVEEKLKRQGRKMRPIRAMIIGIPNVGKSTLINRIAGRNVARTGNKPGVTRGKQWIKLSGTTELFDTPGILWPKFEDQTLAKKLALTGSIPDDLVSLEQLATALLQIMDLNSKVFLDRYNLGQDLPDQPEDLLALIGKRRGALLKGGEIDLEKASRYLIDDYRAGRLGLFSLDRDIFQAHLDSSPEGESLESTRSLGSPEGEV